MLKWFNVIPLLWTFESKRIFINVANILLFGQTFIPHNFPEILLSRTPYVIRSITFNVTVCKIGTRDLGPHSRMELGTAMESPGGASKTESIECRFIKESIKYFINYLISNCDLISNRQKYQSLPYISVVTYAKYILYLLLSMLRPIMYVFLFRKIGFQFWYI
jgi:hypothetical protein